MNSDLHPQLYLYLHVCTITCTLSVLIKQQLNKVLKHVGLQHQHWHALKLLYFNDASSPGEIADCMHIQKPLATRLIDDLEARGLIERTVNTLDRRRFDLVLTETGRITTEKGFKAFHNLPERLTKALHDNKDSTTNFSENQFVISVP